MLDGSSENNRISSYETQNAGIAETGIAENSKADIATPSGLVWGVAHTHCHKEALAKEHLLEQGYSVYFPIFKKTCRHARKTREVLQPLFPRYIFVGMDLTKNSWGTINNTRGVTRLLMRNETSPAIISVDVINSLKADESEEGIVQLVSLVNFMPGDKVRILDGAFKDYVAIFQSFDEKARVQVLLNFMGRESKITLPNYSIEAA